MWNTPTNTELVKIPRLYDTENIPVKDKVIHLHFFIMGSDWYIAEYDGTDIFWGYAVLNGDGLNAEWGYVSFDELKKLNVHGFEVDRDLHWTPRPAKEIPEITRQ